MQEIALMSTRRAIRRLLRQLLIGLAIVTLMSLTAAPSAPAEATGTTPGNNRNAQLVGQIGGNSYAAAVQGNYVYVDVSYRLVVLDISAPSQLRQVGETPVMPDVVSDVTVSGEYAYVTDTEGGLIILR